MSDAKHPWMKEVGIAVAGGVIVSFLGWLSPPVGNWLQADSYLEAPRWLFAVVLTTFFLFAYFLGRRFAPKTVQVKVVTGVPEAPEVSTLNEIEERLIKVIWEAGRRITDEEVSVIADVPVSIVRQTLNALSLDWISRRYNSLHPTDSELKAKGINYALSKGWPLPTATGTPSEPPRRYR